MGLLDRLERFNDKLDKRVQKAKDLESHAEQLQAQVDAVETMLESNAMLAVPPAYLADVIRVIRRGINATEVDPVTITLLVRWCNEQDQNLLDGKWG